jgi:hypothetical protein
MDEIVGKLNFPGDIRTTGGREVMYSPRHGAIRPVMAEYDEERGTTAVSYAALAEKTTVEPEEQSPGLVEELLRRRRSQQAAWLRGTRG